MRARTFHPQGETWALASAEEGLRDVCEAEFDSAMVVLRGFSKVSGLWTEFVFTTPLAYYETDE